MRLHQVLGGAATTICAAAISVCAPATAAASAPHTVVSGETLWSIATANGLSTESVAAFNGLPADYQVVLGETIIVPAASEVGTTATTATTATTTSSSSGGHTVVAGESFSSIGAANGVTADALAAANGLSLDSVIVPGQVLTIPAATAATTTSSGTTPSGGLGYVPSPYGDLALDAGAADSWNAMREQSLSTYGQDIYPGGPVSAYRTYDQQAQLYEDYLNGTGPLAAPPGTSAHESGTAVDVQDEAMRSVIDALGPAYGWGKTEAPDEWWHVNYGW